MTARSPIASMDRRAGRHRRSRRRHTRYPAAPNQGCTRDQRTPEGVNMPVQAEVTPTLVYAQKGRAISVETVLGPDALLLESFEGEEEIAGGFRYTLGLLGKDPAISAAKLIRTKATVKLT